MDLIVASRGESFSSSMTRSTFSTTTIASSTSKPMASTIPNMVRVLMVKPNAARMPNVPSNTTGTVMVVMTVARKFCRNRYITRNTSTIASIRVCTTPLIDSLTTGVVSYGYTTFMPGGKNGSSDETVARIALAVSSALAPVASLIARPDAGLPSNCESVL